MNTKPKADDERKKQRYAYEKQWKEANRERYKQKQREWYLANKERISKEAKANYRKEHGIVVEPTIAGRFIVALKRRLESAGRIRQYRRLWEAKPENRAKKKLRTMQHYHADIEKSRRERMEKYYADPNSKIRHKLYSELSRLRHPGKNNEYRRRKYWANPEAERAKAAAWRRKNKTRLTARRKARLKSDPSFKVALYTSIRIRKALKRIKKRKTDRTIKLLGCSIAEFREHLEKQWLDGMSWENYGSGIGKWNVHHKRPIVSYDLRDEGQLAAAFHWSNCEPKWSDENSKIRAAWNGRQWKHSDHTKSPCIPNKPA